MSENKDKSLQIHDYESNEIYNMVVSNEDYERALLGNYKFHLFSIESNILYVCRSPICKFVAITCKDNGTIRNSIVGQY